MTSLNAVKKPNRKTPVLPNLSQAAFPIPPLTGYDLIVIGSGPGGEACAVRAAQLGKRVAIVEKKAAFGGPTGLTSKAVREATKRIVRAVDQIGGDRRRQVRGLWKRSFPILKTEAEVLQVVETRDKLSKCGVDLFVGTSEFVNTSLGADIFPSMSGVSDGQTVLRVCRKDEECIDIPANHIVIATGSRPNKPETVYPNPGAPTLPFETSSRIVTASEMGQLKELPNAVAIFGGGVIAVEYATVLAELGVGVSLICPEECFMPFLETEMRDKLKKRMKAGHVLFVHEKIKEIKVGLDDSTEPLKVVLEPRVLPRSSSPSSSRTLPERCLTVDLLLYSGGRNANSEGLGLGNVGIQTSKYGRIVVDDTYRCVLATGVGSRSLYAIGDCNGSGLASEAQQQGRGVAESLFGGEEDEYDGDIDGVGVDEEEEDTMIEADPFFSASSGVNETGEPDSSTSTLFGGASADTPLTLWTIPEIASVGLTSEQAKAKYPSDAIVEGYGYFKDMARGRLNGDMEGYLKVVARKSRHKHNILGVQIMGDGANELIQLGSILVHSSATLEQVSRTPFAAVTLSALLQMACDDALLLIRSKKM